MTLPAMVPAAPASAAAPAIAPAEILAPALGPLAQAMEDARSRIASGQPLMPDAAPLDPSAPPARDEIGRFTTVADAPAEGDAPAVADAPPEGDAPAEAEAEAEAEEGDENPLVVEVPGRREGDAFVPIEVKTPEEAERLRQLVNGYNRGFELHQRAALIEQDRESMALIEARLELDPEGFLFENIPRDRAADVALQVLLEPEIWASVSDIIAELSESDDKREFVRVSLENQRLKNQQHTEQRMTERQEAARSAQGIKQVCAQLVPQHLSKQDQIAFYQTLQQTVADHADRMGLSHLDPRDVPLIVSQRLRAIGVDPVEAASRLFTRPNKAPAKNGRTPAAAPLPRPAQPKSPTGPQFMQAQDKLRLAATGVPAGAGAPSSAALPPPPSGQTLEQRIEWARRNLSFST